MVPEILVECVLFYMTKFFSKNRPKIRNIFENFLKSQGFRLQNGLKWKDFEEFDETSHKTPFDCIFKRFLRSVY